MTQVPVEEITRANEELLLKYNMLGVDNLFEIQGLNLTHNYTVQVSAYNLAGVGPRSEVVMMTSGPHGEFLKCLKLTKRIIFTHLLTPSRVLLEIFPLFPALLDPI